jgi:3-hydroxyisobutyrate dehydrogenase
MLPSSPEVRNVYEEGVLPTLRRLTEDQARRTLCIDSTTLDIMVAKNVAADVVGTGAQMVDAPVSGGMFLEMHSVDLYLHSDTDGQV